MAGLKKIDTRENPQNLKLINFQKGKNSSCNHMRVVIDEDEKEITCIRCGSVITSWEYVMRLAEKSDRTIDWIDDLAKKEHKLRLELMDLERKIRNAKSRLKNTEKKLI
jgi:ribosomal protein S27E